MSSRIKGITIEIGGDTTKLSSALSGVNKELSNSASQLRDVNRLLKLDPNNVELLKQKQDLLNTSIKDTKDKIETLKTAQQQMDASGVDKNSEQYRALQREIISAEQDLKSLEAQAVRSNSAVYAIGQAGENLKKIGGAATAAGRAIAPVSAAAAAAGTASVKTAADFDSSMSQVQATMGVAEDALYEFNGETITGAELMEKLAGAAKEQGRTTAFSAKDAADALNYLALAGYSAEKQAAALPSVLTLAAAGNMDLAYASDLVTDSMSVLGMGTEQLDDFIDSMAKTASTSNTSVAQLGEAILVAGGQATLCGMNTNELNTALGVLANNGIKGSEGGTALRNTLKNLYTPTEKAADAMASLGLETRDSEGNLRSAEEVLRDLGSRLDTMSEGDRVSWMAKIFDTRTIAPASALLKSVGADVSGLGAEIIRSSMDFSNYGGDVEGAIEVVVAALKRQDEATEITSYLMSEFDMSAEDALTMVQLLSADISNNAAEWEGLMDGITNCSGAAQQMADTQLDNLSGRLTILKSGLEGAAISIGEALMPKIERVTEKVQQAVDWFNGLGDSQKELVVNIGLVVAALAPALLIFGKISTGLGSFMTLLSAKIIPFVTTTLIPAISGIAAPVLAAVAVVGVLAASFKAVYDNSAAFRERVGGAMEQVQGIIGTAGQVIATALELLKGVIQKFVEAAQVFWDQWGANIMASAEAVWTMIFTIISTALTWIQDILNIVLAVLQGDWEGAWNGIQKLADDVWKGIGTVVKTAIETVKTVISNTMEIIKGVWNTIWETIKSKVSEIWEGIKTTIAELLDGVKENIDNVKTTIIDGVGEAVKFIEELPGKALTWGRDLIKNFIDGIKEKVGSLKDVVSGAADAVVDFLGFSEPEKGPLSDFHTFAPDMMQLYADGIRENMHLVTEQMEDLAGRMAGTVTGPQRTADIRVQSTLLMDRKVLATAVNEELGYVMP